MEKIISLYKKNEEKILYLFFGVWTSVISIGLKWLMNRYLHTEGVIENIVTDPIAMTFAYITNKKWVFKSKCKDRKELFNEIVSFYSARISTTLLSAVLILIFVNWLHYPDMIMQVIVAAVVVILNYVFSKLFIFKGKK